MRRMIHVAAVLTALAVPASLTAVTLSGPAGAQSPTSVSCSFLKGNTHKITVKKCLPAPPSSYKGQIVISNPAVLATGGTVAWKGDPTANTFTINAPDTSGTAAPCPRGWNGINATGMVTDGTDAGTGTYDQDLVGGTYTINVCNKGNKFELAAGTKAVF